MKRKNMKKIGFLMVICLLLSAFAFFYGCNTKETTIVPTPPTTNLSFLKTQGKDIVNESGEKVFLKGVNFGCWLLWEGGALELPNNPEHQLRAEMEKRMSLDKVDLFFELILNNYIMQTDFAIAKSMGINFIRLPFHHRYVQENQLTKLDEAISWAKNNGIYIMLDLQAAPGSQNTDYHSDSDGNAYLWSNTTYQQQFINLWKILAQRYKDEPTVIGYELLNEPVAPEGTQLVSLYQQAIAAIRAIDNKHIIFLDGNNYAYDFSMFNPPSLGDNIVYIFHTYDSVANINIKVQEYKTFQNNFQVPIMCNEYGGADEIQLTSYFQTEEISYAPWGYKLSFNTPDKTPFYYIPSNHTWRIELLNKIPEWMKASEEFRDEILTAINISNLSDQCKQDLIDILNTKGQLTFTSATLRNAAIKYPEEENELKNLSLKVEKIRFNYTMNALATTLQAMRENELTELMQSLQTQYWEKGTVPW
ncbi:MAG: glycoside hydrolase family 5 protein [Candidatus Thermoplasmatota archaeon]|nr:glycoside hydrolase family 5 protein [Candidatus Thermoplasmatota archaeon]